MATLGAGALLDIVERALHSSDSEWLFLRELRVGAGRRNSSSQRLDSFALNAFPHTGMKRVCYELKTSRTDFRAEVRHPLKRRIGMRYSNEFYFVTAAGLIEMDVIPSDCGLVEAGWATPDEWRGLIGRHAGFFSYDPDNETYCMITVPAPWRDTPGPTWQLVAAMSSQKNWKWCKCPRFFHPMEALSRSPWFTLILSPKSKVT